MQNLFLVPSREQVAPANQAIFDNLQKALGIAYSDNGLGRFLAYQNAKTTLTNKEKKLLI